MIKLIAIAVFVGIGILDVLLILGCLRGREERTMSDTIDRPQGKEMTNSEWKEFLAEKWGVSKACAKEMLHAMYAIKKKDSIKKGFDKRKGTDDDETAND